MDIDFPKMNEKKSSCRPQMPVVISVDTKHHCHLVNSCETGHKDDQVVKHL